MICLFFSPGEGFVFDEIVFFCLLGSLLCSAGGFEPGVNEGFSLL